MKNSETNRNLVPLALAAFLTPFMGSATNLALPAMGHDFNLGAVGLGWVANSYLLSAAAWLVPLGRLADIHGRRRFFLSGLLIFSLVSLLIPFCHDFTWLFVLRALQGSGGAMIFGTSNAILVQLFSPKHRGWALGWSVGATYAGLSLGPTLGGFLIHLLGWRSIFLLTVPLGLAALVGGWQLPKEVDVKNNEPFDAAGSLLYASGLALLTYGLSRLPNRLGLAAAGSGAMLLAGFLLVERSQSHPVLDIKLFVRRPAYGYSNLAALIHYCATAALGFLLSLYLQQARGLSPVMAGLILAVQPVIMALLSPIFGSLSDRVEPRLLASAGMALSALGLLSFALMPHRASFIYLFFGLAFVGLGFGLFSSPNINAVMSSAPPQAIGVASATLAAMRLLGQMFSLGLVTMMLSLFMNTAEVSSQTLAKFLQAFRWSLVFFSLLCIAGIFASLSRGHIRRSEETDPALDIVRSR